MAEEKKYLDKTGTAKVWQKVKDYVANNKSKIIDISRYLAPTSESNGLPKIGTIERAGANLILNEINANNHFLIQINDRQGRGIKYILVPTLFQDNVLILRTMVQTVTYQYTFDLTGLSFSLLDLSFVEHSSYNSDKTQLESKITANTNSISSLTTEVAKKINSSEKGSANGVATLDENSKVPYAQLPDKLLGQLKYGGVLEKASAGSGTFTIKPNTNLAHDLEILGHSGDTNLDALDFGDEEVVSTLNGYFLIASFGGSTNQEVGPLGLTGVSTGDWIVFNGFTSSDSSGAVAFKIDNTDAVASVNGKIGVVTINAEDVGMVAITSAELEEILI